MITYASVSHNPNLREHAPLILDMQVAGILQYKFYWSTEIVEQIYEDSLHTLYVRVLYIACLSLHGSRATNSIFSL